MVGIFRPQKLANVTNLGLFPPTPCSVRASCWPLVHLPVALVWAGPSAVWGWVFPSLESGVGWLLVFQLQSSSLQPVKPDGELCCFWATLSLGLSLWWGGWEWYLVQYPTAELPGLPTLQRGLRWWLGGSGPLRLLPCCLFSFELYVLLQANVLNITTRHIWGFGVPLSTAVLPYLWSFRLRLLCHLLYRHSKCQSCLGSLLSPLCILWIILFFSSLQLPSLCWYFLNLYLLTKPSFELQINIYTCLVDLSISCPTGSDSWVSILIPSLLW